MLKKYGSVETLMEWINSLNLLGLLDIFVAIATIVGCIYTVKALLPQSI
tara:strand:+ start:3030 stop:3176 length:147 start_codon:yes stop_codon:yes gene_type:complete